MKNCETRTLNLNCVCVDEMEIKQLIDETLYIKKVCVMGSVSVNRPNAPLRWPR